VNQTRQIAAALPQGRVFATEYRRWLPKRLCKPSQRICKAVLFNCQSFVAAIFAGCLTGLEVTHA
jgi:hypothetical protein